VQRLEQVRLADSVRPDGEHEPGLQLELEPLVRPEVPERGALDDQPVKAPLAAPSSGRARFARTPV
jgi:hypothetical protein